MGVFCFGYSSSLLFSRAVPTKQTLIFPKPIPRDYLALNCRSSGTAGAAKNCLPPGPTVGSKTEFILPGKWNYSTNHSPETLPTLHRGAVEAHELAPKGGSVS